MKTGTRRDVVSRVAMRMIVAVVPLVLVGCGSLPDTQPFANSTATVRDGVAEVGELTIERMLGDSLKLDPAAPPAPGAQEYEAWEMYQLWKIRLAAADALVRYADSLASITAAGNNGSQAVGELAGTLEQIAGSLPGVGMPSQSVVALAKELGQASIRLKALHDLGKAVERAQPAVEGIAGLLLEDFDDLLLAYQAAHRDLVRERFLRGNTPKSQRYLAIMSHHSQVEDHAEALRASLSNPPTPTELEALAQAEEVLARAVERVTPYKDSYVALVRERKEVEAMFESVESAVTAWLQTHQDLATAIRDKRRPNWRELAAEAKKLKGLIEDVRDDYQSSELVEVKVN